LGLQLLEEFLSIPANAIMVPNDLTQYCLCIYSISQSLGFIDAFRPVAKTSEYDISIFGDWSDLNDKKKISKCLNHMFEAFNSISKLK